MPEGWVKVKAAARYAGVSERTIEEWLKHGLKCSRLPSGLRLIKFEWVDEFLEKFAESTSQAEKMANEIIAKI